VSEEITPANAVPIAKKWTGPMVLRSPTEWRHLVTALVARIEELEKQRDAAVAGLRTVGPTSTTLDWIHAVLQALEVLGAEDAK
jgi:hypothetical protein